ncbi:ThuA domain-containing protein [Flavobacterium sp. PL002]|uniref:ThuA domain-containing protein n=1 Tax=Flavobacterium sp. PL002 TaxID=1897058 RepID=UPI0017877ED0|nr:ThuA domain-containing protein [Flavobacterium sp. PL002]MBE0393180.1 Beta-porphyranase A [Flavobacterium sp. PL002]
MKSKTIKTALYLFLFACAIGNAQTFKLLVFNKTNGYRHSPAITSGITMIRDLGNTNGWTTDDSQDANIFTSSNLSQYKVIIFANTSGDGLFTSAQKLALENFIKSGGGFVGIHAATDTYRDRSWPWYNDLVGGIVQTSPNHTSNNTAGTMDVLTTNEITSHLGSTWSKNEEWYYWERNGGYLYNQNINLLQVRSTGSNSYDASRPTTWYKEYDGGRSFYTALGHNSSDYVSNSNFGKLIKNAILWTSNATTSTTTIPLGSIISIKGSNEKFISSENGTKSMTCNRDASGLWEKFTVVDAGGGKIALKGNNGKYVSSENGTKAMTCTRTFNTVSSIGSWEKFDWVNVSNEKFALKGSNGKYVSVDMLCNKITKTTTEEFSWNTTSNARLNDLETANFEDITVYPNPSSERISINAPVNSSIAILDVTGNIVLEKKNTTNILNTIDISSQKPGIYHVKVTNGDVVNYKKIIIK